MRVWIIVPIFMIVAFAVLSETSAKKSRRRDVEEPAADVEKQRAPEGEYRSRTHSSATEKRGKGTKEYTKTKDRKKRQSEGANLGRTTKDASQERTEKSHRTEGNVEMIIDAYERSRENEGRKIRERQDRSRSKGSSKDCGKTSESAKSVDVEGGNERSRCVSSERNGSVKSDASGKSSGSSRDDNDASIEESYSKNADVDEGSSAENDVEESIDASSRSAEGTKDVPRERCDCSSREKESKRSKKSKNNDSIECGSEKSKETSSGSGKHSKPSKISSDEKSNGIVREKEKRATETIKNRRVAKVIEAGKCPQEDSSRATTCCSIDDL